MEPLTLSAYRHSGKFGVHALALTLAAAAASAFVLGFAYSYLVKWVPFIYLNVLATLGYGMAIGFVTGRVLKATHARNLRVAGLCGVAAGLIAVYFEWNGHVHALFQDAPILCRPDQIWAVMQQLYEVGSWSMRSGDNVTGLLLGAVWAVEAGIIVFFATTLPYQFIGALPYCEQSRGWLAEVKTYDTIEALDEPEAVAALKSGDIAPVLDAKPRPSDAFAFTRLILKFSENCQTFCTLRVQRVELVPQKDGKMKEETKDLTSDLVLPHDLRETVQRFATAPGAVPSEPATRESV